ncbi:AAA family ATPase [Paenibacillus sp. CGMCC 1.16610]|uniref:AAA family ATPase n=1 Tax=Paenibacillus anseongense TaxID=2682845 RepID=A0ABW9U1N2_9BACL|nr:MULTISPECIES: AAA domain-containing protein [Paenibacillus]MBA2937022.1 AAA family ATPase [Paenibacillus sp. CGMCC 1.16610]MVQ33346.1 AAA family ATPase [Paenibacillus anseongense]
MLYVSPSKVARYFYHECERHLVFQSASKDTRERLDIPSVMFESNPVTAAIMEGGLMWEERVVTDMLSGQVLMGEGDGNRISDRKLTEKETLEALRNPLHRFIYQATFVLPESFYKRYGIDLSQVTLPSCHPDLIERLEVDGRTIFRIIDVKSSEALKISHKVQVVIYALMLNAILEEYKIDADVDLTHGGVWLYEQVEPEWFEMSFIFPHVEQFFSSTLTDVVEKQIDELAWHLDYRCEWCPFYDYCKEKAVESSHISLLPYLTRHGASFLREKGLPLSLPEMVSFIQDKENRKLLSKSTSFRNRLLRLPAQLQAITEGRLISYGSFSAEMPKGENIRIILTAQRDSLSGKLFAVALLRIGGEDLFGSRRDIFQAIAQSPEEADIISQNFIRHTYSVLMTIHEYNQRQTEWLEQKTVQTYVTDNYEWNNILGMLEEYLLVPEFAEMVLSLLFHFQCELLADSDDHPQDYFPFPVVVLTSVVSRLFALPAQVAYRLEDLSRYLRPESGEPFIYEPKDYLSFRLTNVMKSDLIHLVWNHQESDKLEWIQSELSRRLWAAESIIRGIRAQAKNENEESILFAWPQKFSFTTSLNLQYPVFSRLAFMARYESILGYLEVRNKRTKHRDEREDAGTTLCLTNIEENLFRLQNVSIAEEIQKGGSWLLSEDYFQGELAHNGFYDYKYKDKFFVPKNASLYYASIQNIWQDDYGWLVQLEITGDRKFTLDTGRSYTLNTRFTDWTTERVLKTIRSLDEEHHWCSHFLTAPASWASSLTSYSVNDSELEIMLEKSGFTSSQKEAFRHLTEQKLTLLWGPPGTGKTHFIAKALLLLIEQAKVSARPLKILVSAFSHAAIENCLLKLLSLRGKQEISIVKYGQNQTENAKGRIDEANDQVVKKLMASNDSCIIGATLYQTQKAFDKKFIRNEFDVVVLDEASQIRVPESLLAMSHVNTEGRLLIVGDHYQLPPIIKGKYTEVKENGSLYDSIFKMLVDLDLNKNYTKQLSDNFRMNETLCNYPASRIYGPAYTAFNQDIGSQQILLKAYGQRPEWIDHVLDPAYPLVLCVTENALEGQENVIEAGMVADLTYELRNHLEHSSGATFKDDEQGDQLFWQEGLFIISPHHAQIRAIRRKIEERGLRPPFFVGTVDKMQGQESQVAIISYGVADPELALQEGQFIYSMNRLNVAITRARSKTILFLSRQLLKPTLEILANESFAEGLHFMLQLEQYCQGDTVIHQYGDIEFSCYRKNSIIQP